MKSIQVLFHAEWQDDIGNRVPGIAAISLVEIRKKLEVFGYKIQKVKK